MKFKFLDKYSQVNIFFSEISDGAMNRSLPEGRENIERFLKKIGAKGELCSGGQPHGTAVEVVNKAGFYKNADGILTKGNCVLGVKTADCVPLLLFAPETRSLGAIHISRGNLIAGIVSESLKQALEKIGAPLPSTNFFFGPHIRMENYPQKEERLVQIQKSKFAKFLVSRGKRLYFDLTAAAREELEEIGASADNIIDCKINTFSDKRFFSARRQGEGEQLKCFLSVIFRK